MNPASTAPVAPAAAQPLSFIERFRTWYEYEQDCNEKTIAMLESVPLAARASPAFDRALGKMGHIIAARRMWLYRMGRSNDKPAESFPVQTFDELRAAAASIQDKWTQYLATLTDADLTQDFEYVGYDGKRRRWRLLDLLTQVFGHAWYHRGQVAMLVKDLGGQPVDTDFIFWSKPTILDGPA